MSSKTPYLVAGLAVASAALYLHKRLSVASESEPILSALTEQVHLVLIEMSQMSTRVRQVLAMKGMTNQISDEEIADIILNQGIAEKLENVQRQVLERYQVTEQEIQSFSDIHVFNEEFQRMFSEAVRGLTPVLPHFVVPLELNDADKMIQKLVEMMDKKFLYIREIVIAKNQSQTSPEEFFNNPEISDLLHKSNEEAERDVLGSITKGLFYSAIGYYSKDEYFEKERRRIDRLHQVAVLRLFEPNNAEQDEVRGIKAVTPDSLPMMLIDATEKSVNAVVALVKPEIPRHRYKDVLKALGDAKNHIETEAKVVFAYMQAEKDSPLVQHEKCADKEAVYVVFARPDVAKRPVACLSIDELVYALRELARVPATVDEDMVANGKE